MNEIVQAESYIAQICGSQKEKLGVEYRPSRHCIRVQCDNGMLLLHTLTGCLLFTEKEEPDELISKWFLVPDGFNENKHVDDVRKIALMLSKKKAYKTAFSILTTTDCNARCFYCYEMGVGRLAMSEKTAKDVANYLKNEAGSNEIRLEWFGGEPLYNIPVIEIISSYLTSHNVKFSSRMTTNGFYLTPDIAKKACDDWNLKTVQITLDGTRDVYNRTKAYIDKCEDPFGRVLDNIEGALDAGIEVRIRLNVNQNNAEDILTVVDILGERFSRRKNLKAYVAFLQTIYGNAHELEDVQTGVDSFFSINKKISQYGFSFRRESIIDFSIRLNNCRADNDSAEVIMPDGSIGKCEHFDHDEMIGTVYSSERNQSMIDAWKERCTAEDMPECTDCPLYPRCINLKMCAWSKHGCTEVTRAIRIKSIEEKMLQAYKLWKEGENNNA